MHQPEATYRSHRAHGGRSHEGTGADGEKGKEGKTEHRFDLRLVVVEKIGELLDLWLLIVDGKIL